MCVGGGGRGDKLFTCLYQLKVQACPPWDCRQALQCNQHIFKYGYMELVIWLRTIEIMSGATISGATF